MSPNSTRAVRRPSCSTYLGGSSHERGRGLAVDAAGSAYVMGVTHSSDFPTTASAFPVRWSTPHSWVVLTTIWGSGSLLMRWAMPT
ncbi:MAG: SBBP repeat-containing protein [Acidobacteria bacterium]|nr:SBBP repeat-containing protein [Acidobacteriota bacterium]